jgi:hypothetical protein
LEERDVDDQLADQVPMGRTCAWCSAAAPIEATTCPSCGAAMAQRESIGDLQLSGLTNVDPSLLDAAGRPLHIPGASPAQGMAGGVMLAAMAGGPVGLAAAGGLAVVGAAEYGLAGRRNADGTLALDDLGRPSEVALRAVERLDHEGSEEPAAETLDPWRDEPGRGA